MDKVVSAHVPAFGGKAASFLNYEQRVTLWSRAAEIHRSKRASLLVLHLGPTARQMRLHSGGGSCMEGVEVSAVIQTLKHYFLPDATDQVFQDVTKFWGRRRAEQTTERFLLEFDILRARAERKIQ